MTANLDPIDTARAWVITRNAASTNKNRSDLYRTTQISEWNRRGRLYACTDGYALFGAWVPDLEAPFEPVPAYHDEPDAVVIASDPDNLGLAMMKHIAKNHDRDESGAYLRFSARRGDSGNQPALSADLAGYEFVIDYDHGRQALALAQYDGRFPNWRAVVDGHDAGEIGGIGWSGDVLAIVTAIAKAAPLGVRMTMGTADDQGVHVEALGLDPLSVFGVAMPNVVTSEQLAEAV